MSAAGSPVVVVCAIIERGDRFLAAQRGSLQSNAGLWEFPGGKIHEGEMPEAALVRELREELGIDVLIKVELKHHRHAYPGIAIELVPFICTMGDGEPHSHEHAAVRWVTAAEARLLCWSPADIPVFEDYRAMKRV